MPRTIKSRGVLAGAAAALAALTIGAAAPPRRALIVSFDGLGGLDLERRLERGELSPDGFARARREGLSAERLEIVTPSLTSVSHASLSTGAPPSATGIVANSFHRAGTPLDERVSGFDVESQAETIWEAAARDGRRVASLAWPGVSGLSPRQSTPVRMQYEDIRKKSRVFSPPSPLADATVALPLGIVSFSPPKSFSLPAEAKEKDKDKDPPLALTFVLVDTADDGRRGYDQLLAFDAKGALLAKARAGEWLEAKETHAEDGGDRDVVFGRSVKVLALAPDLSKVTLYVGPVARIHASPDDFRRTLDREAGVWPEPPDTLFTEGPHRDVASFVEQAARFSRFLLRAFEVARRRGDFTLLMAYQPIVDEAEHALLLVDERQPGYTKERARASAEALRQVMALADRAAAEYLRFEEEGDVVFVSDHGMRVATRAFAIREALRRAGFVKAEKEGGGRLAVAPESPAYVIVGGGIAYVFVNREAPGMTEERAAATARAIAEDLSARRDAAGAPVFAAVLPRSEAARIGLDTPNAGDVIAIAAGSMTLSPVLAENESASLFEAPLSPGEHGYGRDPALDGIFFHVGDGIASARVPSFREVDVAARLAERLGMPPFPAAR